MYDYFRSKNDLLIALVDSLFPPWRDEVEAALEAASSPKARIEAFVRAQLRLASEGRHELPFALAQGSLDPKVRARVAAAHEGIAELLTSALNEMKVPDAETALGLVTGVVRTAIDGLGRGGSPSEMTDAAVAFAVAGVEGLTSQARRTPKRRGGSRRRKGAT